VKSASVQAQGYIGPETEALALIDLHVHSTFSDGTHTPRELIDLASEIGLTCIAITDHDTIAGLASAIDYSKHSTVDFIPGIEISVDSPRAHLLGYGIDINHPPLRQAIERIVESRNRRNPKIIKKLQQLGYDITMEEVATHAEGGLVGRPHIARVLVEKGYFDSVSQAFHELLESGRPAYVDRERLTAEEGIALIREAGGVAVLAHAGLLSADLEEIQDRIDSLIALGLQGIEAVYTEHSDELTKFLIDLASEKGLIWTGGTDFHGDNKPDIRLGTGRGNVAVPDEVADRLKHLIRLSRRAR